MSVDVLHREVVDAVTRHFLRRPRPLCDESANGSRRCIHLYAALLCIYAPFSHTCRNPLTKLGGMIGRRVLLSSYLFDSFPIQVLTCQLCSAFSTLPELAWEGTWPPPAPKRFRPVCDCLKVWQHVTSNRKNIFLGMLSIITYLLVVILIYHNIITNPPIDI